MERELLMTGIGGQGIQLGARLLAQALTSAGRAVSMFGSYGGMMRGGNTEATLVAGDCAIESPPTVSRAWSCLVMHEAYADKVTERVRTGGLAVVNSTLCAPRPWPGGIRVLEVPATRVADELGAVAAATLVALGAYVRGTGIVGIDDLMAALPEVLPPYRSRLLAVNEQALRTGFGRAAAAYVPAWPEAVA
ncbi:2-oxoacid:acceptor oxidoreductase family protein [Streptomyces sp. NPDC006208]|uniref:2-oxoacid:acceptor oxidoreductase family protein n=1 Tax=Streptomyces sp. NPDC006208 TaxID=3156734 RepID=UPI0033A494A8